ncbi:hypothetical protein Trydic_g13030, partial [Trypoxylus dichotomus]
MEALARKCALSCARVRGPRIFHEVRPPKAAKWMIFGDAGEAFG